MVSDRIEFSLVENALDYFKQAAIHAETDSPREWKYALLHTVAGIELLLKARLECEDWTLVCKDPGKVSHERYERGDFESIDYQTALERLRELDINIDETVRAKLKPLRIHRNKVQHFALQADKAVLTPLIAVGFNFGIDFIGKELSAYVDREGERAIQEVSMKLRGFEEFIRERRETISPELAGALNIWDCPRCWQDALVFGKGDPRCAFCLFEAAPAALAKEIGYEMGPEECPHCDEQDYCFVLANNEAGEWRCFSCGACGGYSVCSECGRGSTEELIGGICSDCFIDKVNRRNT